MTDCGASGSTLDRAARVLFSSTSNNPGVNAVSTATSTFLGHAFTGASLTVRPLHSPEHITLPSTNEPNPTLSYDKIHQNHMIPPLQSDPAQSLSSSVVVTAATSPSLSVNPPNLSLQGPGIPHQFRLQHHSPSHHQHYQERMTLQGLHPAIEHQHRQARIVASMAQQSYQQQMIMVQQRQHMQYLVMMQQQQQQQQQHRQFEQMKQQQQNQQLSANIKQQDTTSSQQNENWHDGLDDDAKILLKEHLEYLNATKNAATATATAIDANQDDVVTVGHEGIVQGATIEELAAAWAEAESDFHHNNQIYDHYRSIDDVVNMASAVVPPETYEFLHRERPETTKHDWMADGFRHFEAGNIKEAIYSFEMELQYGNPDNATAWRMLGRCHAENDMDQQAILCLEQAVERDPYSPDALLALGVSYVNELNHERALENLRQWITHNPIFVGMELENDIYGATVTDNARGEVSVFDNVQRLLLRALDFAPSEAANVLEALGVVYNVSRDYEAAVDAFRRAIDLRPRDYQLWNKLGATLANSNRSEEALPSYHNALRLKPKYARAWLNMAISHSNLHNYDEAARCYLQTLSLNPSALHCWSYLRIALSSSERWELIPLVAQQDLRAFKEYFDFVLY